MEPIDPPTDDDEFSQGPCVPAQATRYMGPNPAYQSIRWPTSGGAIEQSSLVAYVARPYQEGF